MKKQLPWAFCKRERTVSGSFLSFTDGAPVLWWKVMNLAYTAFIQGLGGPELLIILAIILLLFGAKKLPELAKGLGKSMKEFKKAAQDVQDDFQEAMDSVETEEKKTPPPVAPAAAPAPAPEAAPEAEAAPAEDASDETKP